MNNDNKTQIINEVELAIKQLEADIASGEFDEKIKEAQKEIDYLKSRILRTETLKMEALDLFNSKIANCVKLRNAHGIDSYKYKYYTKRINQLQADSEQYIEAIMQAKMLIENELNNKYGM